MHFFSYNQNSGLQGGTAPHPIPCLCPLTPQSGPLVHFSSTIGPSWRHHAEVLKRRHIPACLTKHRFPQASTTVVLDQIQMRSVSIFVKDYYAWFNEASCSCRRLLLLWTKVSSFYPPPCCFVVLWFLKSCFFSLLFPVHKASVPLPSVPQMPWTKTSHEVEISLWVSTFTVHCIPFLFDYTKSLLW